MNILIKKKKPKRKTYVTLLKEAWLCKDKEQAKEWLEQQALLLKKRSPGYTLSGAKFIVKMNLGALASKYGKFTEKRIKRLFGAVNPLYGKESDYVL